MHKLIFNILMLSITTAISLPTFAQTHLDIIPYGKVVIVDNTTEWTDTGIPVENGDTVFVSVNGIASTAGSSTPQAFWLWIGPEGDGALTPDSQVPDRAAHSVIAKIGENGTPFYIGRCESFIANSSGIFYLGINGGNNFTDNLGYYVAHVISPAVITTVEMERNKLTPTSIELKQNYPNPFNPSTKFEYSIKERGQIKIEIFNEIGQLVTTLVNGLMEAGNYSVIWNGESSTGIKAASGRYFYQLTTDTGTLVKKMILLR